MKYFLLTIFIMMIWSCGDVDNHKIEVSKSLINIYKPRIKVKILNNESLQYRIKVTYDNIMLSQYSIVSPNDSSYHEINIDFSNLNGKFDKLAWEIYKNKSIKLNIEAISENDDNVIDTSFTFPAPHPPITNVLDARGENFLYLSCPLPYEDIKKIKNKFDIDSYQDANNILVLSKFLKNSSLHVKNEIDYNQRIPVVKNSDMIKYKILLDTVFEHMIVESYPSELNDYTMDERFSQYIRSSLLPNKLNYHNSNSIVEEDGKYYVIGETQAFYEGISNLYLVSVSKDNLYSYNIVGCYIVDNEAPVFENRSYGLFNGNSNFQGTAYIANKEFYGYSPYSVPFVGTVEGDISKVFINGREVNFKHGEEFYFRQSLSLANGYNRISVKLVDNAGNVSTSYIPITIESLKNISIDIDQ